MIELTYKFFWVALGSLGTIIWFFWRRKIEQKPIFEQLQKTKDLISIKKDMDATGLTVETINQLEKDLMARATAADNVSKIYNQELKSIQAIEPVTTQTGMNIESGQSLKKSKNQLADVIREFKKYFSPKELEDFENTNRAWENFSEINARFSASRYEGGSIQPLIYSSTLESAVNYRIAELESELEYIKDTTVPNDERDH